MSKRYTAEIIGLSMIIGLIGLAFFVMFSGSGCADYGETNSPITQPPPDAEPCPECEICEEPEPCPQCPKQDPCECLDLEGEYEQQKCVSDLLREQGVCTEGHHFDVRIWCKEDGQWDSVKTWVYPCDEDPWYESN